MKNKDECKDEKDSIMANISDTLGDLLLSVVATKAEANPGVLVGVEAAFSSIASALGLSTSELLALLGLTASTMISFQANRHTNRVDIWSQGKCLGEMPGAAWNKIAPMIGNPSNMTSLAFVLGVNEMIANENNLPTLRKIPAPNQNAAHNLPRPHILDNPQVQPSRGTEFSPPVFNQPVVGGVQVDSRLRTPPVIINNPPKVEQNIVSLIRDEGVREVVINEKPTIYICNETEENTVEAIDDGVFSEVTSTTGEVFLLRPKSWGDTPIAISNRTGHVYYYKRNADGSFKLTSGKWHDSQGIVKPRTLGDSPLTFEDKERLRKGTNISKEVIDKIPLK